MRAAPDPAPRPDPAGDGIPAAGRRGSAGGSRPPGPRRTAPAAAAARPGPAPGPAAALRPTRSRLPSDRPCAAGCSPSSTAAHRPAGPDRRLPARAVRCPAPRPGRRRARADAAALLSRLRRRRRVVVLQLLAAAARRRRARARRRLRARVRVLLRPDPGRRRQQPGRADLLRRRQPAHPARARSRATGWSCRSSRCPRHVREAVLAAEDRSFYSNPGFDLTGILRAAWNQLRGGVGGGSTITQQYVKNTLVGDEATLWRKYREMVVAVKISQQRSKDEILGDYLNAIYFGRGAYGIQSAAHAYFGKPVTELTPAEGALLAGLIQSPSRWDPALNPDKAEQRWNFVLDGMVAQGWLPRAERDAAVFPATVPRRPSTGGMPGRRAGARRHGGARRARGPGHHRAGAEPGGPADHHDGRPGPAAGGGRGGARGARRAAGQPAQRDGGRRPGDRRGARLLRRRQRRRPGLRARPAAGRARRSSRSSCSPGCARTRRSGSARPSTARPGRGCATPRAPSARGATSSRP